MAGFNADAVPWYSDRVQGKVRGKSEKMRKGEGWMEGGKRGEEGRKGSVD